MATGRPRRGMLRALGDLAQRIGLAEKMGKIFEGDRDLYSVFGWRTKPTFDDYLALYLRGDISARIVDLPVEAAWRKAPVISVGLEGVSQDPWLDEFNAFAERVRLWHYLQRVDKISGIGQYAVILIGTRDGDVTQPPTALNSLEDVIYLSVFSQGSATIKEWVTDSSDPRFGLPLTYEIDLAGTTFDVEGKKSNKKKIPWERVIHVPSEGLIEDDVFGTPRLQKVLNRLDDMNKLLGGSAELFWQNVAGIWHADLSPDVTASPDDMEAFEDDLLEARHGLSRLIQTRGVTLSTVTGAPVDPKGAYEPIRQLIAAAAGIPERILFGSERGELASSQDQKEWDNRIESRQEQHVEPVILRAVLSRLILLGALDEPMENTYWVSWPPRETPTMSERADIAQKVADAVSKIAPEGAGDIVFPPWEFREEVLGLPAVPPVAPEGFSYNDGFGTDNDEGDDA